VNARQDEFLLEYLQFPKGATVDILDALQIAFTTEKEPAAVVNDLFG
jgi:hypothetical protein